MKVQVLVALVLLFVGCARVEKKAEMPSDGKVEGTLTINGKSFPLKYVYAGKKKLADSEGSGGIEVLVTNEPLSYDVLSRIFLELEVDLFRREEETVLKGTSVKALYFEISEDALESTLNLPQGFRTGMLMTTEAFFDYSSLAEARHQFDEFGFTDGIITARATNKWNDTAITKGVGDNIEITAQYTVSFQAKVSDQSLLSRSLSSDNKSWQESLPRIPEEGNAQGTLVVSQRSVELKHAYALKEKVRGQGGETFEAVTLLLSDRPIRKEFLLLSLKRGMIGDGYGLRLRIDESGSVAESFITHPYGQNGMFDATSMKEFKVENGRVVGVVENRERGSSENEANKDSYAVSFDAPLKY